MRGVPHFLTAVGSTRAPCCSSRFPWPIFRNIAKLASPRAPSSVIQLLEPMAVGGCGAMYDPGQLYQSTPLT